MRLRSVRSAAKALVHAGAGAAHRGVDGVVHVPAAGAHFDEAHASLDETAGEEAALAEAIAVEVAGGLVFLGDVERFEVLAREQVHGFVVELGVGLHFAALVLVAEGGVELVHERDALLEHRLAEGGLGVLQAASRRC